MADLAIQAEGLGKRYVLGQSQPYKTLRESLARFGRKGAEGHHDRDEFWALRDVSFDLTKGETLGIVGRNGAGKSTLLKILSRITDPTEGRAQIYGRVGSLLEVGTGFHPELTGRENIYLNGSILGMKRAEITRKFDEIVAFSEIENFLDTPVKRYSSGMYVRLAFAVAAHLEPEILIVDEVLAVGDAAFQRKCLGKMSDTANEGRTIIFISHNMAAVTSICSRALFIEGGRLISDGPAGDIVAKYQETLFTETLDSRKGSYTDLTNAPSRYGAGEVSKLLSVALHDENSEPTDTISLGQEAQVEIGVRFLERIDAPEIGICITSLTGQRVSHIVSTWEGLKGPLDAGDYVFKARIPSISIIPGPYSLTLWSKAGAGQGAGTDDGVSNALSFEVLPKLIRGQAPPFGDYCQPGEVYLESEWQVERA